MIKIRLTRHGEYAIRCALELARHYGAAQVTTKEVASKQEIPIYFLSKILGRLIIAGLVVSQRGAAGGISLARPPHKISLREVIEAVEGPLALNKCLAEPGACSREAQCKVHPVWVRAQEALLRELEITLDQLI
ncbi:MAG TPA: Rrf2 family transcriptional regulator [Bacillota bacterium]|nr:Rrf2 family transcriptional regulator [Bacillota bacterium]